MISDQPPPGGRRALLAVLVPLLLLGAGACSGPGETADAGPDAREDRAAPRDRAGEAGPDDAGDAAVDVAGDGTGDLPTDPGEDACEPVSCLSQGVVCGPASNGCGRVQECGSCADGQTCAAGGTACLCTGTDVPLLACGPACVDSSTDAQNCGACGRDCRGTSCELGHCAPATLATGLLYPRRMVMAGDSLVFTVAGSSVSPASPGTGGAVQTLGLAAVPADGGPAGPPGDLVGPQAFPFAVAVRGDAVYFTAQGDATVRQGSLQGGPVTTLATAQNHPVALVTDGQSLYWVNRGDTGQLNGSLARLSLSAAPGTPPTLVAEAQDEPVALAVEGGRIYWLNQGNSSGSEGELRSLPVTAAAGSTPSVLATQLGAPQALTLDATDVYVATLRGEIDVPGGAIYRIARNAVSGSPAPVRLAGRQRQPVSIVLRDGVLYWANAGDDSASNGSIVTLPLAAGQTTLLASGQDHPAALVVDADSVYWLNDDLARGGRAGALLRVPR